MSNFDKQAEQSLDNIGQSEHDKTFYAFLNKLTVPKKVVDEMEIKRRGDEEGFFDNETYG